MPGLGEQSVVDAVTPATVAGYVLKETIGKGGAGTVYRAARPGAPDVALKTVQAGTPAAVASLRNEIRVLRRVRHPGVVEIVDDGVEAGVPWLAMTLVHGDRLDAVFHDRAPSRRAPLDRALLTILRRIAETLAFLHGRGLVHRDLSPRNIIVRDQHPVLIDFGFASIASEEGRRRIDESTTGLGTLPYLSPEQICRDEIDARTDLYAFGCLLYEALTGRPPFVGSPQEIVRAHLTSPVVPPSRFSPGVSPELDAVVGALLAKDRRARTGYALDVVDRLAVLGADGLPESASARPQTYLYGCSLVGLEGRRPASSRPPSPRRAAEPAPSSAWQAKSGVGKTRLLASEAVRHLRAPRDDGRERTLPSRSTPRRTAAWTPSGGPSSTPLRSLLQLAGRSLPRRREAPPRSRSSSAPSSPSSPTSTPRCGR